MPRALRPRAEFVYADRRIVHRIADAAAGVDRCAFHAQHLGLHFDLGRLDASVGRSSGNRITTTGQANIPDGGSFDKGAYDREEAVSARSGNPWEVDPNRFVRGPSGAAGLGGFNTAAPGRSGPTGATEAPTFNGGTQTVNIVLNGKSTAVGVGSNKDADALAGVFRELQAAQSRSGF